MTKRLGLTLLVLCLALSLCAVTALAANGSNGIRTIQTANNSNDTLTTPMAEPQDPMSSVIFRHSGFDIQQSIDNGQSWETYSPTEEPDYFTYDEFSEWLEIETAHIQELVEAGEWTEAKASETIANYKAILDGIANGQMVSKRGDPSQDQIFFTLPNMDYPETYQTFLYDGNEFKVFGPFDTEEELYNALEEYTKTQVSVEEMLPAEASALLEKYK